MKTRSILTANALLVSPSLFADETTKKEEAKPYKPDTCIVSDEKLGEMGKPYVFVYEGQEIKLCCKSCLKKFNKEPDKYLKKLDEKK
jgi:YHS domain-containing protein